jgi:glutamate carboxypeptidase
MIGRMATDHPDPRDRLLDRLRALVELESPSVDVPALQAAIVLVAEMVRADAGRPPRLVELDGAAPSLLLEATRAPRVLLLCHVDTVWPRGALADVPFAVTEGRATGPGVFDMKAGLVIALEVLRTSPARDHVTLLVTADEETGSTASRGLIERIAATSAAVLVLEGSGPDGALKHARKGVGIYDIEIEGRAAHAGTEPERGVNATVELARLVLDLVALADQVAGTSVTPTVARSGTTTNTVPAVATLAVDVRAWRASELERVDAAIRSRATALPGAIARVRGGPNRLPLEVEQSAWLLGLAREAAADLGLGRLESAAVGGGSDGNLTAALGIPTLDGLGAIGGNGHAPGEWVEVASLGTRAALVARLVERVVEAADAAT